MVRRGVEGGAPGGFKSLKAEPVIESAACALLTGYADPMAFLANAGDEWDLAAIVVERAIEIQNDRWAQLMKVLVEQVGRSVGAEVARQFASLFRP